MGQNKTHTIIGVSYYSVYDIIVKNIILYKIDGTENSVPDSNIFYVKSCVCKSVKLTSVFLFLLGCVLRPANDDKVKVNLQLVQDNYYYYYHTQCLNTPVSFISDNYIV